MNKIRIISALSAAAIAVSLFPASIHAAETIKDYNFDDGRLPAVFKVPSDVKDWSVAVEETEDGGYALKYTFDKSETLSNGKNLFNPLSAGNRTTGYWEYGFSYKIDKLTADFTNFMFMSGGYGQWQVQPSYSGSARQFTYQLKQSSKKTVPAIEGQWVDVKMYLKNNSKGAAKVTQTYEKDGAPYTETIIQGQELDNAQQYLDTILTTVTSNANMTDGESFWIDNIYLKKITSDELPTVTFDTDGGTEIAPITTIMDSITLPTKPKKEGYEFGGWYKDKEFSQPFDGTGIYGNMTVYVKWNKIYTITFESGDAGITPDPITTTDFTKVTLPTPQKKNYYFDGWYIDEDRTELVDLTELSDDVTLYAKWIREYTVSFETNGGSKVANIVTHTGEITLPQNPSKDTMAFEGWYRDQELTIKFDGTGITEDITVYANWIQGIEVKFDSMGGSDVESMWVIDSIDVLPVPVKQGFGFIGWYKDRELTIPFDGTGVTEPITVYAKYSNVLFHEDFENTDGAQYLKQLAPTKYEDYMKEGYGVVTDAKGNKSFRLAWEKNKTLMFNFEDGGPGLYEISFKISYPQNIFWFTSNMSPRKGNTYVVGAGFANYFTFANERFFTNQQGKPNGMVDITYVVDTVNKVAGYSASYVDRISKQPVSAAGSLIPFTTTADSIDNIQIGPDYRAEDTGSDYYIDDIIVRKLDQPYIESISPEDGAVDVDINSEVKVCFNTIMDTDTLTDENLNITDEDGNRIASEMTINKADGKTVVTLKPKATLEYEKTYKVNARVNIMQGISNLDKTYETAFKTRPNTLEFSNTLTIAATGEKITSLSAAAGRQIRAVFKIRNFGGEETQKYFVGAALTDTKTGRQMMYRHTEGTIQRGEEKAVLNALFDLPIDISDDCKIIYYIWSSSENRTVLADTIAVP